MSIKYIHEIEDQQVRDLLEQVNTKYNYDFTQYSFASVKRRIKRIIDRNGIKNVESLKLLLMTDETMLSDFIEEVTVNVTEMFRDPGFYVALKRYVFPQLETYPHIKIWHAGCSTGEEVYSMAILLREAGLLDKSIQYATDINTKVLEIAMEGIYPIEHLQSYTANYQAAGGQTTFSNYYTADYGKALIDPTLRKKMIFSSHNLVTDHSFNEFQLIVCRNVLIYFNRDLQQRVLRLFKDSLPALGYLALGSRETLHFTSVENDFKILSKCEKIWRKIR